MSKQYKLIIYATVAMLHFHRDALDLSRPGEKMLDYANRNSATMRLISAEILDEFDYEISSEQLGTALRAYLCPVGAEVRI